MVYNRGMITCDDCKKTGKIKYYTFEYQNKFITLCHDCRYGVPVPRNGKSDKSVIDSLHVPFWQLMGQKAKPHEIAYEKYLKSKNMTYGDAYLQRNYHEARNPSGLKELQKHIK